MSKPKARKRKLSSPPVKQTHKRKRVIAVALILMLGLTGLILAQWRSFRTAFVPLSPPPQTSSPQLSKEYIYAGGKLVATEEPTNGGGTSPLSAPSSLVATGSSSPQVTLTWTASTGGTVAHYIVERMQSLSTGYTAINQNVTATSYTDSSVSAGAAYLYRVRAVDSSNNLTNYSNIDLATTITFTDDPLQAGATPIKAQHITELRQAIDAVRTLANLSAASWTNTIQSGVLVHAIDVQELRTNLDQARSTLNLSAASYTDQPLTAGAMLIKKVHLDELRLAVK
jgi:hypothetical protein